jgi:hypothetical protein
MDYVKGIVEEIIEPDLFEMSVEFIGNHNQSEYDDFLKIRIMKIDPPYLKNLPKDQWKDRLIKRVKGKRVYAYLNSKEKDGTYRARVELTGPDYRGKK